MTKQELLDFIDATGVVRVKDLALKHAIKVSGVTLFAISANNFLPNFFALAASR